MAEYDGEKTQDATPHRRQQAREEGHVARSQRLLGSAALLILGLLALHVRQRAGRVPRPVQPAAARRRRLVDGRCGSGRLPLQPDALGAGPPLAAAVRAVAGGGRGGQSVARSASSSCPKSWRPTSRGSIRCKG